jgi:hypothetical protein
MFCNDEHKFLNALKKSSALDNKEKVWYNSIIGE